MTRPRDGSEIWPTRWSHGAAVQQVSLNRFATNGSAPSMDGVFGGGAAGNPVDPIESERMAQLIVDARADYDLVVVDSPPVSVVPDAIPLIRQVDGVVLVSARRHHDARGGPATCSSSSTTSARPVLGVGW